MQETTKSEYDGRLKYYNLYEDVQRKYADSLLEGNYRGMFHCLLLDCNQVCMFWPGGVTKMNEAITALRAKMEKIDNLDSYDDNASYRQRLKKINEFIAEISIMENDIQLLRAKHRLLFPMSVDREPETEEEHADIYEQETYGSVTKGEKDIPSYEEHALDYGRVDNKTKTILKRQRYLNEHKDADAFYLIAGYNNTGKSTLGHHLHALWSEGEPNAGYCSFDPEQFAGRLGLAMAEKKVKNKVAHWDEANFTGRGAMSKYNRDVIDLYWSNRSEHGLHLWCNPSIEYLEKVLVKERVTAVFLIHRGEFGNPSKRKFSLITRKSLQNLWKKEKKIDLDTLEREAKKYQLYEGWFYDYPRNDFLKKYISEKAARNKFKNDQLKANHAADTMTIPKTAAMLGVTRQTVSKHLKELDKQGKLSLDEITTPTGRKLISAEIMEQLRESMKQ